jgi:hypothetical protein
MAQSAIRKAKLRRQAQQRHERRMKSLFGSKRSISFKRIKEENLEKMSEVLSRFIEPYKDTVADLDDFRGLVSCAALAWNLSMLPPREREEMLNEAIDDLSEQTDPEHARVINGRILEMIERKHRYFSQYSREIINFHVEDVEGCYSLQVISLLE